MPSTLQALRRKAGFATAREFADHIGVPFPTYSRYESSPGKIPIAAAWSLADRLGCTIDAVVGRASIDDVELSRGEVQREYDALGPDLREQMDSFRAFLRFQAANREKAAQRESERTYERLVLHYEEAMRHDLMEAAASRGEFYQPLEGEPARDAFRAYVEALAADKRRYQNGDPSENERRDAKTVDLVMAAYDRMHDWADRLPAARM